MRVTIRELHEVMKACDSIGSLTKSGGDAWLDKLSAMRPVDRRRLRDQLRSARLTIKRLIGGITVEIVPTVVERDLE